MIGMTSNNYQTTIQPLSSGLLLKTDQANSGKRAKEKEES